MKVSANNMWSHRSNPARRHPEVEEELSVVPKLGSAEIKSSRLRLLSGGEV
jgi:hypothetical protein